MYRCIQCGRPLPFLGLCPSCKESLARLSDFHSEVQKAIEEFQRYDRLVSRYGDQMGSAGSSVREVQEFLKERSREVDLLQEAMEKRARETHRLRGSILEPVNEIDRLARQLNEGLDAVMREVKLAAFSPGYEELAQMAVIAKPAWSELLTSPTASYAFAAMATLREAIERAPFADETIAALHNQLGDWSRIELSAELFDQQKRQEAYLRAGLDRRLIEVEPQTFDTMLEATELRPATPPPLLRAYTSADLSEVEEVEEGEGDDEVRQAVEDYEHLYRFESQLRGFVANKLAEEAGSDWFKQRVPGDCLTAWKERRQKDREAKKHVHPLPSYADLGDWPKIILRKDNWNLFQRFFNRQTFVQESFNRLIPLRNDVAHMHPLTEADRLVFYAEIQQLLGAIRGSQDDEDDDTEETATSNQKVE